VVGGHGYTGFLALAGRPILQYSVDAFVRSGCIDDVVVALPPDLVRRALAVFPSLQRRSAAPPESAAREAFALPA